MLFEAVPPPEMLTVSDDDELSYVQVVEGAIDFPEHDIVHVTVAAVLAPAAAVKVNVGAATVVELNVPALVVQAYDGVLKFVLAESENVPVPDVFDTDPPPLMEPAILFDAL